MTPNNNYCPLAFYPGVDLTSHGRKYQHHRKPYAFGKAAPLLTPQNRVPPFQFIRPVAGGNITWATLYSIDGSGATDVLAGLVTAGLTKVARTGYDVIMCPSSANFMTAQAEGEYFLEMGDGTYSWTSEVFCASNTTAGSSLVIEYWDEDAFSIGDYEILYGSSYKNRIFLQTALGKPEYPFEEEVTKRDGYAFIERQISEKKYRFSFLAPEYLVDAMRLIRMHDYVTVVDTEGRTYNADTFLVTPAWQEQGDLASVDAEFTADTVVKKLAKATAITV